MTGLKDGYPFQVTSEATITIPLGLLFAGRLSIRVKDIDMGVELWPAWIDAGHCTFSIRVSNHSSPAHCGRNATPIR
jgi:hypothetical protein